jgi:alkanesulfonate monooxygenase SsuD/methylene tetrahydromethanopterin reductase-like flavin-dependent oxidoreductase (luciferase family)
VSSKQPNTQRGLRYDEKPVEYMRTYLTRMRAITYMAPVPKQDPPIVLAALLPKMVKLAGAETQQRSGMKFTETHGSIATSC